MTLGNSGVAATEYLTRYFSHSHDLFDANGNLLLNTDIAIQSMKELIEAKDYSPKRYNSWWRESAREFAAGDTAMSIIFSNYASEMMDSDSVIINKIGYTYLPGQNSCWVAAVLEYPKTAKTKRKHLIL